VLRVYDINYCPPACIYRGETTVDGGNAWKPLALPRKGVDPAAVTLAGNSSTVDLEEFGFPAGGSQLMCRDASGAHRQRRTATGSVLCARFGRHQWCCGWRVGQG
jgi:hypothetical protein